MIERMQSKFKIIGVKAMKVIAAHEASDEQLEKFMLHAQQIELKTLFKEGYVVIIDGKIQGCFILSTMEHNVWLKQLYIMQRYARYLPVLIETIVQMSKKKQAKKLYVHSHQPAIDLLLDALQFHLQNELLATKQFKRKSGNWWAYDVS